jgi:hypothetical protein
MLSTGSKHHTSPVVGRLSRLDVAGTQAGRSQQHQHEYRFSASNEESSNLRAAFINMCGVMRHA